MKEQKPFYTWKQYLWVSIVMSASLYLVTGYFIVENFFPYKDNLWYFSWLIILIGIAIIIIPQYIIYAHKKGIQLKGDPYIIIPLIINGIIILISFEFLKENLFSGQDTSFLAWIIIFFMVSMIGMPQMGRREIRKQEKALNQVLSKKITGTIYLTTYALFICEQVWDPIEKILSSYKTTRYENYFDMDDELRKELGITKENTARFYGVKPQDIDFRIDNNPGLMDMYLPEYVKMYPVRDWTRVKNILRKKYPMTETPHFEKFLAL